MRLRGDVCSQIITGWNDNSLRCLWTQNHDSKSLGTKQVVTTIFRIIAGLQTGEFLHLFARGKPCARSGRGDTSYRSNGHEVEVALDHQAGRGQ